MAKPVSGFGQIVVLAYFEQETDAIRVMEQIRPSINRSSTVRFNGQGRPVMSWVDTHPIYNRDLFTLS